MANLFESLKNTRKLNLWWSDILDVPTMTTFAGTPTSVTFVVVIWKSEQIKSQDKKNEFLKIKSDLAIRGSYLRRR